MPATSRRSVALFDTTGVISEVGAITATAVVAAKARIALADTVGGWIRVARTVTTALHIILAVDRAVGAVLVGRTILAVQPTKVGLALTLTGT